MKKLKPKKLNKGDTIGILAVSGRIKEIEKINLSKEFFESLGYKVIISPTCYSSHRYMAGNNDDECIKAFEAFFADDNVDAIFCARGGYGTLRLINKINWKIVENNPKIFAGYSDITVLHSLICKKTGLITFHSAMPNGDFSYDINNYTKKSFFSALEGRTTEMQSENGVVFKSGSASGILWGGNLASIVSLCGTDFIPDEDIILFLEDLNEPEYKIDKMLTQLFNIEKFRKNVKGIALGEFQNIENEEWFNNIIYEYAEELNIPISGGFKFTHGKVKDTIPYGIEVDFCADKGLLLIKEEYVTGDY